MNMDCIKNLQTGHRFLATLTISILFAIIPWLYPVALEAGVSGHCATCHTMHNSQNSTAQVHAGSGARWTGGVLTGGATTTPRSRLLTSDCVGCHSNTGTDTIVTIGTMKIPIVFNTSAPTGAATASTPLAGGNFYWVATAGGNDPTKGHNVRDISAADPLLAGPPGPPSAGCGPCHSTLTQAAGDYGAFGYENGGCESCHVARHHAPGSGNVVVGKDDGWYRFLGSTMEMALSDTNVTNAGIIGIEDPDWEQTVSVADHNGYNGTAAEYNSGGMGAGLANQAIGQLCVGCHQRFHGYMTDLNVSSATRGLYVARTAWLRHPSDVPIPNSGEYSAATTYSPIAPVAKVGITAAAQNTPNMVPGSDVVMCLSCHRAHGSPYPDMLRWDYENGCNIDDGANPGCGCFVCHTAKDT